MTPSLSTWAIRNPIPPILLFLLLTVGGLFAYAGLPITNMPNVAEPVLTVRLSQPGALPSEMETQVTQRVEGALAALPGVRHLTSTITEGVSLTTVEFGLETDIDRAVNDARNALATVRNRLPATVEEPIVQRREEAGSAILIYSVEAPDLRPEELTGWVDETVSRELLSIGGVARVTRDGGAEREVTLTLDPAKAASLGITAADISRQLALAHADVPGGRLTVGGTEYALRTVGRAPSLAQLRDMRVALASGHEAKLGDLGTLEDGGGEPRTVTRLDGRPAVTFSVFRTPGASEIEVARQVRARLSELAAARGGIAFDLVFSQVTLTENGYRSTLHTFGEGAVLTLVVVFLFLRDRRATVITALSLPLSIVPTFLCIEWLGFTLNFVSLVAISLVTGALVDDAIVEIENIHRHMKARLRPLEAALQASEEIGLAVVATTLVICAVFIPVSFMGGVPGLYFRQFGLTVAIAAFFSLAVARLITPMLAARFLRPPPADHRPDEDGRWMRAYLRLVAWTLAHRRATLALALASVLLSFALLPLLPSGFMPYQDFSLSSLSVELPQGSTLQDTDAQVQRVAAVLKERPEVRHVLTRSGQAGGGVNRAQVTAVLVPREARALDERGFAQALLPRLQQLPDLRIAFDNAGGQKDIALALVGDDPVALVRSAEAMEREMRGLAGLTGVGSTAGQQQPEITVAVDAVKAARLGITAKQIGDAVNTSTLGDADARLAQFNDRQRQVPIRVRLPQSGRDLGMLDNLPLATPGGSTVPLSSVAQLRFGLGPTTIERHDQRRRINLEANLNGVALGTALAQIQALPSVRHLPPGLQVLNTEDAEFMAELMGRFLKALGAGLLMVYAIQVLLYKDWLQPLTRMAALPLSVGGAFALMAATGTEFGLPAMIGILMLMGISDKNSILLVDCVLERMRAGMPRHEALLQACRARARPIVMTSFAMTAGMVPTALGAGLDAAFRAPMAIAVIGGLVSSTALSLVFMPVLFSCVRDVEEWWAAPSKRHRADPHVSPSTPLSIG